MKCYDYRYVVEGRDMLPVGVRAFYDKEIARERLLALGTEISPDLFQLRPVAESVEVAATYHKCRQVGRRWFRSRQGLAMEN